MHNQLWLQAVASKEKASTSDFAAQFIQPLNEIIALHTRRVKLGLEFRIPNIIWVVLYIITALAAASIGYHSGLIRSRRPPIALGVIIAFSVVIFLIEDLDRPENGFLDVSQRALTELQMKMNAQARRVEARCGRASAAGGRGDERKQQGVYKSVSQTKTWRKGVVGTTIARSPCGVESELQAGFKYEVVHLCQNNF